MFDFFRIILQFCEYFLVPTGKKVYFWKFLDFANIFEYYLFFSNLQKIWKSKLNF